MATLRDERCDIRVWSAECKHDEATTGGDKYLCRTCETIDTMQHEVRHDFYSYVSGDYHSLS